MAMPHSKKIQSQSEGTSTSCNLVNFDGDSISIIINNLSSPG